MELLSNKQIRMLGLLDEMISKCTDCDLHINGRVKPYWTPMSTFAALGESPDENEVKVNEPFVGKAGGILGKNMAKYGFRKDQFLIINTVNCRPTTTNGKPIQHQITACKKWTNKYIKVLKPDKMMGFGNYARGSLNGNYTGIVKYNSWIETVGEYGIYVVYSVHPAYCIYQGEPGEALLRKSIEKFRDLRPNYE